jgi:hypothetical protein
MMISKKTAVPCKGGVVGDLYLCRRRGQVSQPGDEEEP